MLSVNNTDSGLKSKKSTVLNMKKGTLIENISKVTTTKKILSISWVNKDFFIEIVCFLLMIYFFYEGIYKIVHLSGYGNWLFDKPYLGAISGFLKFAIPIFEIALSVLLLTPFKKRMVLYFVLLSQIIFVIWILNIFPFKRLIFNPYHSYWIRPRWFDKIIFTLCVSWVSLIGIYLLTKNQTRTTEKKNFAQ
jgi:uncharacterized membrane protein YphA (DoxX/SURF4 family)